LTDQFTPSDKEGALAALLAQARKERRQREAAHGRYCEEEDTLPDDIRLWLLGEAPEAKRE
jgi:hypothetical protein